MSPIRTALAAEHERLGAHLVNFAGFLMPVHYTSILDEARTVRHKAGLFDLCHMGRVRIRGRDHLETVGRLVTCDVDSMKIGQIRYALMTREDGTIIDDVLVYREPESTFLCINAGNRHRDLAWLRTHAAGTDSTVDDASQALAMIAIQGPRSVAIVRRLTRDDPGQLGYYRFFSTRLLDMDDVMVSRTGYTGEDGFEFYFPVERAVETWNALLEAGRGDGLSPIGLGARDTLRLEAGMPLYGHEIDDSTSPIEAGLAWAVGKSNTFVGCEAIRELLRRGTSRKLVGFTCGGRRVPRYGYALIDADQPCGEVRSGTLSPTLGKNIGTAYVASELAEPGRQLALDLRGERVTVEICDLPFYRRGR